MKWWKGSYTVEAAVLLPILIGTMAIAMCMGISLLEDIRREQEQKRIETLWVVDEFYNYQVLKEVTDK